MFALFPDLCGVQSFVRQDGSLMRRGPLAEVTSREVGVIATNPSGIRKAYDPLFANFAESFCVRFSRTTSLPFSSVNTGCLCWV